MFDDYITAQLAALEQRVRADLKVTEPALGLSSDERVAKHYLMVRAVVQKERERLEAHFDALLDALTPE